MPYAPLQVCFAEADARLIARVAERLQPTGLAVERGARPQFEYDRIGPIGADEPAWIVVRSTPGSIRC